jgi:hypothetical protein
MFEPILPKKKILIDGAGTLRKLTGRMDEFTADLQRRCMEYEPPATSSYRRTNALKNSWSRKTEVKSGVLVGEVMSSSATAPYNIYVRGPKTGTKGNRQAKRMAERGWKSITEIIEDEWPKAERDFRRIIAEAG